MLAVLMQLWDGKSRLLSVSGRSLELGDFIISNRVKLSDASGKIVVQMYSSITRGKSKLQ